jgi:hypothetical protein
VAGSLLAWARTHDYIAITLANVGLGSLWFLGAALLRRDRGLTPARAGQVRTFFVQVDTDVTAEEGGSEDRPRHLGIARMCFIYGGFIGLLALISFTWSGRLGLAFCACFMLAVGWAIRLSLRR